MVKQYKALGRPLRDGGIPKEAKATNARECVFSALDLSVRPLLKVDAVARVETICFLVLLFLQ